MSFKSLSLGSLRYFAFVSCGVFFIVFLICFLPLSIPSQTPVPTPPKPTDVAKLEQNTPVERTISGTPRHTYLISLSANQYIKINLEQRGVDVGARLYGTDDRPIMDVDAEMRINKPETIEFVSKNEGTYRLDIINRFPNSPAGKYEIRIVDIHQASEKEIIQQEARSLFAESIRFNNAGKLDEAKQTVEKAIEINKRELGAENLTLAINLNHLARIFTTQGEYEKSIKTCLENLAQEEKFLGSSHPVVGITLNCIASGYRSLEDYPRSVEYFQRALTVWEKELGETNPAVAVGLMNLGGAYRDLGDKIKSIEFFQKALTIQEKADRIESYNTAAVLINLGLFYTDEKDYTKAEAFLLRAVAILEKIYSPNHPDTLVGLFALASCYSAMQKLDKAEEIYARVLNEREKVLGANHPLTAFSLLSLANIYARKNDFIKSEPLYRRALKIREEKFGETNTAVSGVLSELVILLSHTGNIQQALQLQKRSNEINERNISLNLTIGSERQKLAFLNEYFNLIDQNVFLHIKFAPDDASAAELAATTILRQKGRVLDAASNNLEVLRRRFDQQDRVLLDNLNKITRQISELIVNGPEGKPIAEHQSKIKTLTDEREKLEDEISRRAAGFFVKSEPVSLRAVQAVIPADSRLLEFAVYRPLSFAGADLSAAKRYAVYIVQDKGEVKWKDLGEAKQIDDAIDALRKGLREPSSKDIKQLARAVDEKVMQPVRALLGDGQKLFISPDGELNLMPFEALVDEKGNYLIENYSVTYLTSGRDLLRMQTARTSQNKSLIVANPLFGESADEQIASAKTNKIRAKRQSITTTRNLSDTYFAPLGGTIQEALAIQRLFPDALVLSGAEATETALKNANAPLILHIATHGFFLQNPDLRDSDNIENPLLRSGLALTGANKRGSDSTGGDGILTALESSGLNLWGTKLVVLSACDTGLGEVKNGEGVYGLRRAFVLAGTETLMMSLWSVSDYVTRELMTNYYKNLKNGLGRGAALRQTQLEMLKKKGREHPFYWAAFVQSGEWANLDGKR